MTKENGSIDISALEDILNNLVTYPDDVAIERKVDEMGVLLSVKVNSKDMGIVIGRNGIMASSIKVIMKAVGKANNMNIRVQFLEPDGSLRYADKKKSGGFNKKKTEEKEKKPELSKEEVEAASEELDKELDEFVID